MASYNISGAYKIYIVGTNNDRIIDITNDLSKILSEINRVDARNFEVKSIMFPHLYEESDKEDYCNACFSSISDANLFVFVCNEDDIPLYLKMFMTAVIRNNISYVIIESEGDIL